MAVEVAQWNHALSARRDEPHRRVEDQQHRRGIVGSRRHAALPLRDDVPRESLPPLGEDEYYAFQLVGLTVEEDGGRFLGHVADVVDYPANDVLELDSGLSLPLVEACVRSVDVEGGRIVVAPGFADPE